MHTRLSPVFVHRLDDRVLFSVAGEFPHAVLRSIGSESCPEVVLHPWWKIDTLQKHVGHL